MATGKIIFNLGQALVKIGSITEEQCKQATHVSQKTGKRIKDVLVSSGFISESDLEKLFSRRLNLPVFSLHGIGINPKVKKLIPRDMIEKHLAVPVYLNGNILAVATDDPLDFDSLKLIADLTQKDILTTFTRSSDIIEYIEKHDVGA